jgi:hypothetical protein
MKFTWGTGIFLFLSIFIIAAIAFIIFASRQHINLVHSDYYEKGVNHTEQMKIKARSKPFAHAFEVSSNEQQFLVEIEPSLATVIDSGQMYMYRPSDSKQDLKIMLKKGTQKVGFNKNELNNGRYVLKFSWYSKGLAYEINRPVNVQ